MTSGVERVGHGVCLVHRGVWRSRSIERVCEQSMERMCEGTDDWLITLCTQPIIVHSLAFELLVYKRNCIHLYLCVFK